MQTFYNRIPRVWYFPIIVLTIFLILIAGKMHGSSIGMFHQYFYGASKEDPALLFGEPLAIRSDEWVVTTPFVISQDANSFRQENDLFQEGQDLGFITDAPYLGWSVLFKPQLLSFFILPLENAFAFKWWFGFVLLLISVYLLVLKIFPDRYLFASLGSIVFCFNPFIFWWFLNGTITPLYTGFFMMIIGINLLNGVRVSFLGKKLRLTTSKLIWSGLFSYLLSVFSLVLYPPFQIPVAIVIFFFLLGYLLSKQPFGIKKIASLLWPFILSLLASMVVIMSFMYYSSDAIRSITGTVYPGERLVRSGGYDQSRLQTTYLQGQLQSKTSANGYFDNPSEASNFIINSFAILVPSIFVAAALYYKYKKIDWILTGLIMCNLLFLAHLFITGSDIITRLFFLQTVPHQRLVIGLGLLGFITLLYVTRIIHTKFASAKLLILGLGGILGISFAVSIFQGFMVSSVYPSFVHNPVVIVGLCTWLYLGLFLMFSKKFTLVGIGLLAGLSLFSSFRINPLYSGLDILENNKVVHAIQRTSNAADSWGVVDAIYLENMPQVSGRHAITGTFVYPDMKFYEKNYPKSGSVTYNRYAHVFLSTTTKDDLTLLQPDVVAVSLDECSDKAAGLVTRLLSTKPLTLPCFEKIEQITYPNVSYFLYKKTP